MAEIVVIGEFSTDARGFLQTEAETQLIPNLNVRRVNEVNRGSPLRIDEDCIKEESASDYGVDALRSFLEHRDLLANTLDGKPYDGTTIVSRYSYMFSFKPKNVWRDGSVIYIEEKKLLYSFAPQRPASGVPLMPKYKGLSRVTEWKLTDEADVFPEVFPRRSFTYRVFEYKISPDCRLIVSKKIDSIYEGKVTEIQPMSMNSFTGLDHYRFNDWRMQRKFSLALLTGIKQYCFAIRDPNDAHITNLHFVEDITRCDTIGYTECARQFISLLCTQLAELPPSRLQKESDAVLSFDNKNTFLSGDILMTQPTMPNIPANKKRPVQGIGPLHTIVFDGDRKIPQSLYISRAHVISMDTFRKATVHGDRMDHGRFRFPLKYVLFLTNQETFESILHSNEDSDDVIWRFYDENESMEIPSGF